MPEHAENRPIWEAEFQARLDRVADKYRPLLIRALGNPPDPRNIDESLWRAMERENREVVYWPYLLIFSSTYNILHNQLGSPAFPADGQVLPDEDDRPGRDGIQLPPATRQQQEQGRAWADQKSRELAAGMQQTNERRIERAVQKANELAVPRRQPRVTFTQPTPRPQPVVPPDFAETIEDLLNRSRIETISITETSDAISNGENAVRRRLERELGWVITKVWRTERDDRVCPICQPLHGTDEDFYGPRVGAPPAHVRCRCWEIYRVVSRGQTQAA